MDVLKNSMKSLVIRIIIQNVRKKHFRHLQNDVHCTIMKSGIETYEAECRHTRS